MEFGWTDEECKRYLARPENISILEDLILNKVIEMANLGNGRPLPEILETRKLTTHYDGSLQDILETVKPFVLDILDYPKDVHCNALPISEYLRLESSATKKIIALLGGFAGAFLGTYIGSDPGFGLILPSAFGAGAGYVIGALPAKKRAKRIEKCLESGGVCHQGNVYLAPSSKDNLLSVAAHEYTHRVQVDVSQGSLSNTSFSEGHANGVQLKVLRKLYQRDGSLENSLIEALYFNVLNLTHGYLWSCGSNQQVPNEKIANFVKFTMLHPYAIGQSVLDLLENESGPEIYSQVLKEKL